MLRRYLSFVKSTLASRGSRFGKNSRNGNESSERVTKTNPLEVKCERTTVPFCTPFYELSHFSTQSIVSHLIIHIYLDPFRARLLGFWVDVCHVKSDLRNLVKYFLIPFGKPRHWTYEMPCLYQ